LADLEDMVRDLEVAANAPLRRPPPPRGPRLTPPKHKSPAPGKAAALSRSPYHTKPYDLRSDVVPVAVSTAKRHDSPLKSKDERRDLEEVYTLKSLDACARPSRRPPDPPRLGGAARQERLFEGAADDNSGQQRAWRPWMESIDQPLPSDHFSAGDYLAAGDDADSEGAQSEWSDL